MVKLSQVCSVLSGFAFKSNYFGDSGIPLVRIRDVMRGFSETYYSGEYDEQFVVNNNDILIGMDGDFNIAKWAGGEALLNQRVCKIAPVPSIVDADYLYYFLPLKLKEIWDETAFVTVKHLSVKKINDIEIPLPKLSIQKEISAMLRASDSLRNQSIKMESELNALAQAVFLEMFGDPISNPLAWSKVSLDEIAQVQGGLQVTGKRSSLPVTVDYLRVANVHKNELKLDQIKTIQVTQSELDRTCLKIGDMLVVEGHGNKDEIGRTAVWDGSIEYCTHQNHLIRVRFDESVAVPEFISRFLNSDGGRYQINKICNTTSGLNTISANSVRSLKVPLPPIHLQRKFISFLNALKLQESKNLEIKEYIKTIFEALMQRSFSGKLNLNKVA
ncbi:restriction endonuclease subunit S [Pantoea sp. DY-15]|uniref:restriction endonuclease subunit S n=1 Tax=Pantoea sp. DY-15 TaxID=2871489 RepID=UPI001C94DF0E|nr:restriction endonuclease subunit S [Pantoea sp. DY-15]